MKSKDYERHLDPMLLELNKLPISVTCVRVPVMVGHAMTLFIKTFKPPSTREIAAALGGTDQLRLDDIPTPVAAAGLNALASRSM